VHARHQLTFHVADGQIGEVVTNIDCKAQDDSVQGDEIVKNFKKLVSTYAERNALSILAWFNFPHLARQYNYSKKLDVVSHNMRNCCEIATDLMPL
jgi:hypothetical protein